MAAKETICNLVKDTIDIKKEMPARQNSTGRSAKEASFDDIVTIMNKLDVIDHDIAFLVEDVSRVPPIAPESGTMMALMEELTKMKNVMNHLRNMVLELRQENSHYTSWPNLQRTSPGFWEMNGQEACPSEQAAGPSNTASEQQEATLAEVAAKDAEKRYTLVKPKKKKETVPRNTKKKKTLPKGTAEGSESFQSGPMNYKVVLTYVHPDATTESVKKYITDKGIEPLNVEEKSSPEWDTKRFVVKMPADSQETVMTPAFWPKKIAFKRWFDRRSNRASPNDNGAEN